MGHHVPCTDRTSAARMPASCQFNILARPPSQTVVRSLEAAGETLVRRNGVTSELGLPVSAQAQSDHVAIRNHADKQVVGRAGDGTEFNWRRFICYSYPMGADSTGVPVETWYTTAQSYSALLTGYSLASLPATPVLHAADSRRGMVLHGVALILSEGAPCRRSTAQTCRTAIQVSERPRPAVPRLR